MRGWDINKKKHSKHENHDDKIEDEKNKLNQKNSKLETTWIMIKGKNNGSLFSWFTDNQIKWLNQFQKENESNEWQKYFNLIKYSIVKFKV